MIYDCCCFNGEKDLLRIRAEELKPLEVIHVLVESTFTFSGKAKPLHFQQCKDEFKDYPIIHIVLDEPPMGNPWHNEAKQRNACMPALQGCKTNDVIIISDVDEIPRASSIAQYKTIVGPVAMQMDIAYYYLNVIASKGAWNIGKIMPRWVLDELTPNEIRNSGVPMALLNCGWHYGYQGGVPAMLEKFASFSHQEEAVQRIAKEEILMDKVSKLESLWGPDRYTTCPITDLPVYVQENQEEFKHMIYVPERS